ncbi:MAG: amidohydrolase family protein [Acetobacteraceae bacterium]|nr:amidohydrolase family protein [Acetobacteraceae bacterium]
MSQHSTPKAVIPKDGIDCHMHVFGELDAYPPSPKRSYTPRVATLEDYLAMLHSIGMTRNVFVQASAYGTDNRCMLDALRVRGHLSRGVAVIDPDISESALDEMHALGVRGVRLNIATFGLSDQTALRTQLDRTIAKVAPRGWHVQIFAGMEMLAVLRPGIEAAGCPIVIDHMGLAVATAGLDQPGFLMLKELLGLGHVWVKVSGFYRVSHQERDFSEATPYAAALIAANPQRCVWGTDWPHTGAHGRSLADGPPLIEYRKLDDGVLLDLLAEAAGPHLHRVLVDNPAKLYQF